MAREGKRIVFVYSLYGHTGYTKLASDSHLSLSPKRGSSVWPARRLAAQPVGWHWDAAPQEEPDPATPRSKKPCVSASSSLNSTEL